MIDLLKENIVFLSIVFAVLLVIVVAYLLYTWKSKANAKSRVQEHLRDTVETAEVSEPELVFSNPEVPVPDEKTKEQEQLAVDSTETDHPVQKDVPFTSPTVESQEEDAKEDTPTVEPIDVSGEESDEDLEEPVKTPPNNLQNEAVGEFCEVGDEEANEDTFDDEEGVEDFEGNISPEKRELGRYHVIFRKSDKMWIVKREGSHKVIKTLHTQNEGIAYATIKSIKQKTTFVIHKRDGKIRKQNY